MRYWYNLNGPFDPHPKVPHLIVRSFRRYSICLLVLLVGLAACGNSPDDDRSFAPEIRGDDVVPTETLAPTATQPSIDAQPNEGGNGDTVTADLFNETGAAVAVTSGLDSVNVTNVDSGQETETDIARTAGTLAAASGDGAWIAAIARLDGAVQVSLVQVGNEKASPVPISAGGEPQASPVASLDVIQLGDRIAWAPDNQHVIVAVSGLGMWLLDTDGDQTPVNIAGDLSVTAIAWSMSGQSFALGTWDTASKSASILTLSVQNPGGNPATVLALPVNDGRYVRSMVWGTEEVGVVFALRSSTGDMTVSNDLYAVSKLGTSMQLISSAGVAAPIAAIDQIALAANGTTIAFAIQVPGEVGLRFHSVWVTDAMSAGVIRANTTGIRKVFELDWTSRGLVVVGTRRVLDDGDGFVLSVVERLSNGAPESISVDRSPATPVGSPVASPAASPAS
jgi:hypothetical protein